jgi:hypothetical protein
VPSRATELTAVFLNRNITAILGHRRMATVSRQRMAEPTAIIHLCGAGPAKAFARRGFHLLPGERCSDHDVAGYLAQKLPPTLVSLATYHGQVAVKISSVR